MIEEKLWELIRKDIQINDFINWVYANPDIEITLGYKLYLRLLNSSDIDEVFNIFQDWIYEKYNIKTKLINFSEVIEACKYTIKDKNNFIKNIIHLIKVAPENHPEWNDDDWGALLLILDSSDHYPFFVESSLVHKDFLKRMNNFDKEMRTKGIQYCENLLKRYSDSSIIKLANNYEEMQ